MVRRLEAPAFRSPVSPTLPDSLARDPFISEAADLAVRSTTNSCVTVPVLRTLNVTLPLAAALTVGLIENSRNDTPTVWPSAGAAATLVTAGAAALALTLELVFASS